jgi:hypothetical protein
MLDFEERLNNGLGLSRIAEETALLATFDARSAEAAAIPACSSGCQASRRTS